jgi:hypothetical protein
LPVGQIAALKSVVIGYLALRERQTFILSKQCSRLAPRRAVI